MLDGRYTRKQNKENWALHDHTFTDEKYTRYTVDAKENKIKKSGAHILEW